MGQLAGKKPLRDGRLTTRSRALRLVIYLSLCAVAWFASAVPAPTVDAQSGRVKTQPTPESPKAPGNLRPKPAVVPGQIVPESNAASSKTPSTSSETTSQPANANANSETEGIEEIGPEDTVRVNSNLVTVPASVVDSQGRALSDLKLEDFEFRVDGQPKQLTDLSRSETPVRLVMLFDNSMSLLQGRDFEKQAAVKFLSRVMRPVDQGAIFSIYTFPILSQPFTHDVRTLIRTIDGYPTPVDGATALFDTLARASDYLRPYQGRKVIVIVSDGADTVSDLNFDETMRHVLLSDCQVYAVQTGQSENANLYNLAAYRRLQEFTAQTGGAVYVPKGTRDLDTAFAQIAADLAEQYVLSYYPTDDKADGRFRIISLRIANRPTVRVRARKGYYPPKS